MDDATVNKLLEHLKNCGYVSEGIEEEDKLTINLPRADFTDSQLDVLASDGESQGGTAQAGLSGPTRLRWSSPANG